ncbi:peptidylprolyl isomerase [Prevotella sp. 10(H)]|uniref:peptidylprolyl isomerase n=1 Tax=Prevotella sp. 10(H) TaxID=1158294 RepID=UPI0004A70FEB|nr:peptidylprolyl isomerase [Prevotella sp. 10(H)]
MIKKPFLSFIALLTTFSLFAQQNDPIVFKINDIPVYKSEFEQAYKKGDAENKESINDFLQSYINFKMNVAEAKAQQLDTTEVYQRQFSSYRLQIAEPYLKEDDAFENEYITKIYNRMLENVEINHVMFPFFDSEIVLPSDTLRMYKKAMEAREKILKSGFTGADLTTPNSGSVFLPRAESRNGYVGWVSPFMFSAKVEDAIYSLPVMEVSMPIRAARGYHIIQVLNRRQALGSAEIEQVLFKFTRIPPPQQQIDSVGKVAWREYNNIKHPADFQSLCDLFSKVHQTGDKGCYFGVVSLDSNLPMDFTMAAFNLEKEGDISKPVMSNFGYHIIRLIRKIPLPTFDKIKYDIRDRIYKSDKVQELSDEKRRRLKSYFNVTLNDNAYRKLLDIAETVSPRDSAFLKKINNGNDILFSIEGKRAYPVREFAKYIYYRQKERQRSNDELRIMQIEDASPYSLSTDILQEYLDGFQNLLLSDYEESTLENRFPEFKNVVEEFSDGLLFFEVQDRNIWKRAKTDKAGLEDYFATHKSQYSLTESKYKGMVVYAKDETSLKKAESIAKKKKDTDSFIREIKNTLNKDLIRVRIEPGSWLKGENSYVDNKIFGGSQPKPYEGYPYFFVTGKMIDKPEDYTDVRNEVERDYQEKLEKDWNSYLKSKYKIEIDESVLNSIK